MKNLEDHANGVCRARDSKFIFSQSRRDRKVEEHTGENMGEKAGKKDKDRIADELEKIENEMISDKVKEIFSTQPDHYISALEDIDFLIEEMKAEGPEEAIRDVGCEMWVDLLTSHLSYLTSFVVLCILARVERKQGGYGYDCEI